MDEQETADYLEPCSRCAELQWGVTDEGQFYCKNCHNVIERSTYQVDPTALGTDRMSSLRTRSRAKRPEGGRQWMVCEGFQFILRSQADALVHLGVHPSFKDEVLVHLWRLYLQRTHQAYTHTPVRSATFRLKVPRPDSEAGLSSGLDSESGLESQVLTSSCDSESRLPSTAGSVCSTGSTQGLSDWSQGSLDSDSYLSQTKKRRSRAGLMSMRKTLALLHVALTWSRQPITLADLLRLVQQGHVPYVNAYECFPEEMKLSNRDGLIFRVQSVPSYQRIHRESKILVKFLQLQAFPRIEPQSPLHPLNLSLRLLTDLNLPDEMAGWVESVLDQADLMKPAHLTFDLRGQRTLPHYELLAAAAVIVAMKLLFGLDDRTEWELSSEVSSSGSEGVFSLRRWYRLLQHALLRAQRRTLQLRARRQWVPNKPFYFTHKEKVVALKRRRVGEQLTSCFKRLTPDRHGDTQEGKASVFQFLWGRGPDADGRSLHHMTLEGGTRLKLTNLLLDEKYWHPPSKTCSGLRSPLESLEPVLPQMFLWLLRLVSFVVAVEMDLLFNTILNLEQRLLRRQTSRPRGRGRTMEDGHDQ